MRILLLTILAFTALLLPVSSSPHEWFVMTSHLYPKKGLELRIVAHEPIEVYCTVTAPNGHLLASSVISVKPMVTKTLIRLDGTNLVHGFSCYKLVDKGK